jgi:ATP-dependent Lon protease
MNPDSTDLAALQSQIQSSSLPDELRRKATDILSRLAKLDKTGAYDSQFQQAEHYLNWITNLPWSKTTKDILDLVHARQVLDSHHYGLVDLKQRILEYLSVLILNERKTESAYHAPVLLLVGLVGTGKTTLAKSIAESLGRQFVRIPFGGLSSALDLRGQSRVHPEAEPGLIIKSLRKAAARNPVILLDEIDRVAESAHGEIMGVLVELLDPQQNSAFTDHYIDFPFDLSQAMFIATCNNTTHISTAVMDRLEPITMPSYTDEEKIHIGKDYVLPSAVIAAGLPQDSLKIADEIWPKLVRPLGFDAGIRTLERTIQGIVRRAALKIVSGSGQSFYISDSNLKDFLPTT